MRRLTSFLVLMVAARCGTMSPALAASAPAQTFSPAPVHNDACPAAYPALVFDLASGAKYACRATGDPVTPWRWLRQDLPPCAPDPPSGPCTGEPVCKSNAAAALHVCHLGNWTMLAGSGGGTAPSGTGGAVQYTINGTALAADSTFTFDSVTKEVRARRVNGRVHAASYATTGDGTDAFPWATAGSNPIQAAVNDCAATGCEVYLEEGTYDLGAADPAIDIPRTTSGTDARTYRIVGAGMDLVTLNYSGTGTAIRYWQDHTGTPGSSIQSNANELRGFSVRKTANPRQGTGIWLNYASRWMLSDLSIGTPRRNRAAGDQGFATGIRFDERSAAYQTVDDFNTIEGSYFSGNTLAIRANQQADNLRIRTSYFEANPNVAQPQNGVLIRNSNGVEVAGNTFNFFRFNSSAYALRLETDVSGVSIRGNYLEGNWNGIWLYSDQDQDGVEISGNFISLNSVTGTSGQEAYGIRVGIDSGTWRVRGVGIRNNTIAQIGDNERGVRMGSDVRGYVLEANRYGLSGASADYSQTLMAGSTGVIIGEPQPENSDPALETPGIRVHHVDADGVGIRLHNRDLVNNENSPWFQWCAGGAAQACASAYADSGGTWYVRGPAGIFGSWGATGIDVPAHATDGGLFQLKEGADDGAHTFGIKVPNTGLTASRLCTLDANGRLPDDCVGDGVDGGSSGGYTTIEEETTPLTSRSTLRILGASVTCADATTRTDCTFTDDDTPDSDAEVPDAITVNTGAGGQVTQGTGNRCARWNNVGVLVPATGDCTAGDTGGTATSTIIHETVSSPTAATDRILMRTTEAITVSGLYAAIQGTTSLTWDLVYARAANATTVGEVLGTDTVTSSAAGATVTATNPVIPKDSYVRLKASAVSGTPSGVFAQFAYAPAAAAQCNDGLDNDADTLRDFPEDDGCASATDDDEATAVAADILFWLNFEANDNTGDYNMVTTGGTKEYSESDTSGSFQTSNTCSADGSCVQSTTAQVGTYALRVDMGGNLWSHMSFSATSIVNLGEGSAGAWYQSSVAGGINPWVFRVGGGTGYIGLRQEGTGLYFYYNDGTVTCSAASSVTFAANTWYYLEGEWDATADTYRIHVTTTGGSTTTNTGSGTCAPVSGSTTLYVGGYGGTTDESIQYVDNFAISNDYDRDLTAIRSNTASPR